MKKELDIFCAMPLQAKKKGDKKTWSSTLSRNSSSVGMKFRPPQETPRELTKGRLPCAEAVSIQQVILMMLVHLCRKIIYGMDISYRVTIYVLGTLLLSVVSDYKTKSSSQGYFGRSDNFLNQWFVKLGWLWTFSVVGGFVYLTSHTFSCGRSHIVRNSLGRLAIASLAWWSLTALFDLIEHKSGLCELTKYRSKATCTQAGYAWKGFDISGHAFILVFSNLLMIEEGKAYLGWERIKDYLRNEDHNRVQVQENEKQSDTPLAKLKNEEFLYLRTEYPQRTPWVRLLFCLMAVLMTLWDFMLLCTVLYFHMMIEKVVACGVAVLLWFCLYKFFYNQVFSPGLPGSGIFKYCTWKDPKTTLKTPKNGWRCPASDCGQQSKWSSKDEVPKFMGMPLTALRGPREENPAGPEDLTEEEVLWRNSVLSAGDRRSSLSSGLNRGRDSLNDLRRGRSRSRSRSRSLMQGYKDLSALSKSSSSHINPVHF